MARVDVSHSYKFGYKYVEHKLDSFKLLQDGELEKLIADSRKYAADYNNPFQLGKADRLQEYLVERQTAVNAS